MANRPYKNVERFIESVSKDIGGGDTVEYFTLESDGNYKVSINWKKYCEVLKNHGVDVDNWYMVIGTCFSNLDVIPNIHPRGFKLMGHGSNYVDMEYPSNNTYMYWYGGIMNNSNPASNFQSIQYSAGYGNPKYAKEFFDSMDDFECTVNISLGYDGTICKLPLILDIYFGTMGEDKSGEWISYDVTSHYLHFNITLDEFKSYCTFTKIS